jgi:hypothetical protein
MQFEKVTPLVVPSNLDDWGFNGSRRRGYQQKYSFAIPCEEALAALVELGPIVEVGAGNGYWAQLLRERGADVLAFDLEPEPERNDWISLQWGPVAKAPATVAGEHPDRALLLIWPARNTTAASDALGSYGGDWVAYIGEGIYAHDADDRFFELLEAGWDEVRTVDIPQWDGMHDRLEIYRRR